MSDAISAESSTQEQHAPRTSRKAPAPTEKSGVQVPLLDLRAQYATIRSEVEAAVLEVLASQWFIMGPKVEQCEREIAEYCHCDRAVGVSSGTDAILIALMAEGIGPGDEVITTPYTFFATAGCITRLGATPVFVDIRPDTYNLAVSQIESRITAKTKAIIPVHLFGQCADMEPLLDIAERHGLVVIEDAAQAIGAEYHGRRAGSLGHYGCFSFFPSKNLGGGGDGGMVVTQDDGRAERLRSLRAHGSSPKYYHKLIGGNFRLDAIQAAIVSVKLPYLDQWTAARQANAARYAGLFKQAGLLDSGAVRLPQLPSSSLIPDLCSLSPGDLTPDTRHLTPSSCRHVFNQFVIRVERRDELRDYLRERGVATEVYYPVALHRQECFSYLGYQEGDFPQSEAAARETLALPVYPELTEEQIEYVADCVSDFLS